MKFWFTKSFQMSLFRKCVSVLHSFPGHVSVRHLTHNDQSAQNRAEGGQVPHGPAHAGAEPRRTQSEEQAEAAQQVRE